MIKKLKVKFTVLAMSSLFALLTVIVTGMNMINYNLIIDECDEILSIVSQNKGMFPEMNGRPGNKLPPGLSPETPYESRYFSVVINPSGTIIDANTSQIISISRETAIEYAQDVIEKNKPSGFINEYRYIVTSEFNGIRISFLDCGRRIDAFNNFLYISIGMAFAGFLVVFVIFSILSGRIVKPIVESYEKQKRFITDAGHELKTPLTIINANVDILEMELGEDNESLNDIHQQTRRLRTLTDDLVMLSRVEESESIMPKIDFPISEIITETAHSFSSLAASQEKEFICNIQPMLSLYGNVKEIERLVYLLLDNSLKYSPSGGTISLSLTQQGRNIVLSVFNTTVSEINAEQIRHVFDRFYRTDNSRNSETGGYGIGLSVAKAIVTAHHGTITASTRDGHSFQISVVFSA